MRKIVLAAAIATSALGLAACAEEANEVDAETDAMAADAESIADEATMEAEEAGNDMEAMGDEMAADMEATGDEVEAEAEEAAADAEAMMEEED